MDQILGILNNIKTTLENFDELLGVNFILSFPIYFTPKPLLTPTVAIAIKTIDIKNGPFSGYLETIGETEYFGNSCTKKVSLNIYVPEKNQSTDCYSIFCKIYKSLLSSNFNFSILNFSAKNLKYDPEILAFSLECEILIHFMMLFK